MRTFGNADDGGGGRIRMKLNANICKWLSIGPIAMYWFQELYNSC